MAKQNLSEACKQRRREKARSEEEKRRRREAYRVKRATTGKPRISAKHHKEYYYRTRVARLAHKKLNHERRRNDPEYQAMRRSYAIKSKFGITAAEYDVMLARQGGKCALCGRVERRRLAVDHDHKTGRVRGLLCTPCNTALGTFGDDIAGLEKAIDYIRRTEAADQVQLELVLLPKENEKHG